MPASERKTWFRTTHAYCYEVGGIGAKQVRKGEPNPSKSHQRPSSFTPPSTVFFLSTLSN